MVCKLYNIRQYFGIVIAILALIWSGWALPRTDPPLYHGQHFMFMWNAPTELCESRFNMPLDLSHFQMVTSTLKSAVNQSISLFYVDRFGLHPHVNVKTGKIYDKGLPQLIDMNEHYRLAANDIQFYMPGDQTGLAVLDFEEWRPLWVRNWGSKDIYRRMSIEEVKKRNPTLSDREATNQARAEYEHAAKTYFVESIRLGRRLKPNRLWGYYLFPDCYNYGFNKDMATFTGQCPPLEKKRNNDLMWLWRESTALFPSIYLELVIRDSLQARWYVRHRIHETMRVSTLPDSSYSIPIHAYIRPLYKDTTDVYMSEFDLVNTIGEAAALGAAGVISWGDMNVVKTRGSCFDAQSHLDNVMNPYILNVTTASQLCSESLCQGNGRCVRQRWDDDVFLHLSHNFWIGRQHPGGPLTVNGSLTQDDVDWFASNFDCMCYSEQPCRSVKNITEPVLSTTEPPVLSTTEPPVLSTTEPPVLSTTEPPVLSTTEPPVLSTTEPPVLSTTEPPVLSTTEPPILSTTEPPVLSTTMPPVLSTTKPPALSSTEPPILSTTEPPVLSSTKPPVLSTTETALKATEPVFKGGKPFFPTSSDGQPGRSVKDITEPVLSTTMPPVLSSTKPPILSTTEPPVLSTTKPPVLSSTKPPVLSTTETALKATEPVFKSGKPFFPTSSDAVDLKSGKPFFPTSSDAVDLKSGKPFFPTSSDAVDLKRGKPFFPTSSDAIDGPRSPLLWIILICAAIIFLLVFISVFSLGLCYWVYYFIGAVVNIVASQV